nr:uncharacterized protein LOC129284105 [Lytechinus pictus]
MAGLGESCSHIAALLFKMEAAVRMGYTSTACTEDLCKWNSCFVDNIQPCPVASIEFYSEGAKERHRTPQKRKRKESGPATPEEQSTLLGMLAGCTEPTKVIGLSAFSQYAPNFIPSATAPENPSLPPTLRKLYDANNISLSAQDMSSLCDRTFSSLSITDAQLGSSTSLPRAQSSSLIWHDQSSRSHHWIHRTPSTPHFTRQPGTITHQEDLHSTSRTHQRTGTDLGEGARVVCHSDIHHSF